MRFASLRAPTGTTGAMAAGGRRSDPPGRRNAPPSLFQPPPPYFPSPSQISFMPSW